MGKSKAQRRELQKRYVKIWMNQFWVSFIRSIINVYWQRLWRNPAKSHENPEMELLRAWQPSINQDLRLLSQDELPKIVYIMETTLGNGRMDKIRKQIGYDGFLTVNAIGRSGGLALLWRREGMVEIHNYSQWHISAWILDSSQNSK